MGNREEAATASDRALDREIELALAVQPSPEFVARLRAAVTAGSPAPRPPWIWIGASAAGVAIAGLAGRQCFRSGAEEICRSRRNLPYPHTSFRYRRIGWSPRSGCSRRPTGRLNVHRQVERTARRARSVACRRRIGRAQAIDARSATRTCRSFYVRLVCIATSRTATSDRRPGYCRDLANCHRATGLEGGTRQ